MALKSTDQNLEENQVYQTQPDAFHIRRTSLLSKHNFCREAIAKTFNVFLNSTQQLNSKINYIRIKDKILSGTHLVFV